MQVPQQNGVAKRMNRIIAKTTRYLRLIVEHAKNLWAYVVNMACFLINRSLRVALEANAVNEV